MRTRVNEYRGKVCGSFQLSIIARLPSDHGGGRRGLLDSRWLRQFPNAIFDDQLAEATVTVQDSNDPYSIFTQRYWEESGKDCSHASFELALAVQPLVLVCRLSQVVL